MIALKDVTLDIARGECHGLMGENGAGKSTLGKVLAGIHKPDSGEMSIDGKLYSFNSPRDAMDAGVAMVHQELAFCRDLSVAENLSMGHYPRKLGVMVDKAEMARRADELLSKIGVKPGCEPADARALDRAGAAGADCGGGGHRAADRGL